MTLTFLCFRKKLFLKVTIIRENICIYENFSGTEGAEKFFVMKHLIFWHFFGPEGGGGIARLLPQVG